MIKPAVLAAAVLAATGVCAAEPLMLAALYGYPIELTKELNGANLEIKTSGGPTAVLALTNHATVTARCHAEFHSGLHSPMIRSLVLKPGKKVSLTYPVPAEIEALKVKVTCAKPEPAAPKS